MAYKNYKIRDNWLDIDKYNDVDIQSVDGVIQTVKVNGEDVGGGGSSGEFKIANITWVNLPETFDDYDPHGAVLMTKTADGFEQYFDVEGFTELLLQWDEEWLTPPKAIVTTKQPENVGDIAVWVQPYTDYDIRVVSGDALFWNRGTILYGDCTLTVSPTLH